MNYFIIDFDSTFIKDESLDMLAELSPSCNDDSKREIQRITELGMEGIISFKDSLQKRIRLIRSNKNDINNTINYIKNRVTNSVKSNKKKFIKNSERVFIVSSGFHEIIDPIAIEYGIKKENIFANNFVFNKEEKIIGFDNSNPLSSSLGKVKTVKNLQIDGKINVIGDGYTDYQIKKEGYADKFYLFIENIKRESLVKNADYLLKSFDQIFDIIK